MTAAAATISTRQRIERILYFFPFQLVLLHLKKNHFLLFFWILLFGVTQGFIGLKYGVWHQFLFPEYMGETGPLSFMLLGFSFGGFILAFNLYTYILHGFRFPFIVTLSRPFVKFSINNFVIPAIYLLCFVYWTVQYQKQQEILENWTIAKNVLSMFFGVILFLVLSSAYFITTNKSIKNFIKPDSTAAKNKKNQKETFIKSPLHKDRKWYQIRQISQRWRVETYMSGFNRIALARKGDHYDKEVLHKVFAQNHVNASFFEIALVITFIMVGSFRESQYFLIPAGASVVLFFTMMLMVTSAVFSYIRGWTLTVLILVFVLVNNSFNDLPLLNVPNHAYGLDYRHEKAQYSPSLHLAPSITDSLAQSDHASTIDILENWLDKQALRGNYKPKLVLLNCSGGGLRSSLWTMKSLLTADSLLDGQLMNNIVLMTGSSGGVIGAAYARELFHMQQKGDIDMYDPQYIENMGHDLLNPVIFTIATNDFFIRYQKFEEGGNTYTKDRGYAFEKQFNINTGNVLNKRLIDYAKPEREAIIPMLVMSPTIVKDGRRMIISAQPMSYLTRNEPMANVHSDPGQEDVEFIRLFEKQQATNLRFTSALRMNATFPYVLPMVTLPSNPPIDVMDAGLRDNFGSKTSMQFLYTFKDWINEHTSGVVIVQTRDIQKGFEAEESEPSMLSQFTAPLGTVYGNFTKIQDYNSDQMMRYLSAWLENDIDLVTLQLNQNADSKISLSWHLTEAEKRRILSAVEEPDFDQAVGRLRVLLAPQEKE
ncbi:MAG: hypothetical protein ACI84C_002088 [Flavobacteriales bacterium]